MAITGTKHHKALSSFSSHYDLKCSRKAGAVVDPAIGVGGVSVVPRPSAENVAPPGRKISNYT